VGYAKEALAADVSDNYGEAVEKYALAIEHFMHVLKWEKNEKTKQTVREKVCGYMKRAEQLKAFIKEEEEKKKNPPKKAAGAHGEDGEDEDTAKLRAALQQVVVTEKPNVGWDDVAGLENAKGALQEAVILPLKMPFLFKGKRKPWKGILLFGPPGTGKSYLAKAVATEASNSTFMAVSSSDLISKWQGQSERLVKELFKMAREASPAIIFVDEVDSMCGARGEGQSESSGRIKTEFLVQMDGVGPQEQQLLVLGATNLPWSLDNAIRRRFEKKIYIPLPDVKGREVMFRLHIGKETRHNLTGADFCRLASEADMRSGADIKTLCKDAIMAPVRKLQDATHFRPEMAPDRNDPSKMRNYMTPCSPGDAGAVQKNWQEFVDPTEMIENPVDLNDMLRALHRTKATVSKDELVELEKWADEFGQQG